MIKSYIQYMKNDKNDEWYTPIYAVNPILDFLPKEKIIWLPFDTKDSNYYKVLKQNGYNVKCSHKKEDKDFFNYEPSKWDILVSNPPFSIKDKILKRCYELGKPFALLLPLSSLEGVFRNELYLKHGVENIIFDKRIGFNKKEGTSFSTGYFCWKLLNKEKIHVRLEKGNGE